MNTQKTRVIFRAFRNGEIIALFPELKQGRGLILSYMHIGQHGDASPEIVRYTKPATREQFTPLYNELTAIGYRLEVRKRLTR